MDDKNQQHIDHELTKAVESLGDAFRLIKDVFSDNQKRYESLAHEIRRDQNKEVKRQRRDAWLIAMISIVGIGASVIAASYWSYEEEKVSLQKTQIAQLYNQANEIQHEIDNRMEKRDELMDAMVNLRGIRDEGQKQCGHGLYIGKDAITYQQKLFAADYAFIGAFYKMTGVFNDAVQNKIAAFSSLANMNQPNICASNAATDKVLRPLQTEANILILDSIEKLRDQKKQLTIRIESYDKNDAK